MEKGAPLGPVGMERLRGIAHELGDRGDLQMVGRTVGGGKRYKVSTRANRRRARARARAGGRLKERGTIEYS